MPKTSKSAPKRQAARPGKNIDGSHEQRLRNAARFALSVFCFSVSHSQITSVFHPVDVS